MTGTVREAPQEGRKAELASHLHPAGSYDLAAHPVPTGREEVWRFTPVKRLAELLRGGPSDGHLSWKYDTPDGVTVSVISTEEAKRFGAPAPMDRLAALAVEYAEGAVLIDVAPEVELDQPLLFRLAGEPTGEGLGQTVWGHVVLRVGRFAKAAAVFEHVGSARYASSVSVLVDDGATLDFVSLQMWNDDAVHTGQISARVGRDARLRSFQGSLGGDLIRLVETAEYAGPGGEVEMTGLYFVSGDPVEGAVGRTRAASGPAGTAAEPDGAGSATAEPDGAGPVAADRGRQHVEHRLFVDHNAPATRSRVDYRGALQGRGAHSVWVGDVLIRKVAEGIDTYESNRNLLLTDGCRADSVPNLEIETGEIEGAGHASATGRFDDEQLFYLRSRGIPYDEARRLVVRGFFAELLGRVPVPHLVERLTEVIDERLARAGA